MKSRLAWIAAVVAAAVAGGALLRLRPPAVSVPMLKGGVRRFRRTASDDWDDLFI